MAHSCVSKYRNQQLLALRCLGFVISSRDLVKYFNLLYSRGRLAQRVTCAIVLQTGVHRSGKKYGREGLLAGPYTEVPTYGASSQSTFPTFWASCNRWVVKYCCKIYKYESFGILIVPSITLLVYLSKVFAYSCDTKNM